MIKRLWLAFALACALLLAATSLLAAVDSNPASFRTKKAQSTSSLGSRTPPVPVASPGDPGDDDMPDLSRGDRRVKVPPTTSSVQENQGMADVNGWRLHDLTAGLRWYLVRMLRIAP
jgi:hypothetical protein